MSRYFWELAVSLHLQKVQTTALLQQKLKEDYGNYGPVVFTSVTRKITEQINE